MSGRRTLAWALPGVLCIVVAAVAIGITTTDEGDSGDERDEITAATVDTTSPDPGDGSEAGHDETTDDGADGVEPGEIATDDGHGEETTTSGDGGDADSTGDEDDVTTDGDGTSPPDHGGSEPETAGAEISPAAFVETFDGAPDTPTPWTDDDWDVTIHSRNVETFDRLEAVEAMHGPNCEGPPATHSVTAYPDAVYQCRDHMMTAINASGYGMIYVTPNQLVDFSDGTAVIKVDVSTLRTSQRDWWDVWISPYDEHLQLPLDLGSDVDVAGPPRNAVRIGIGTENQLEANIYRDFVPDHFDSFPDDRVPGELVGYETILEPDPARRDTFEIQISRDHLKVGMPAYDFWWIDSDIEELGWDLGVVQFGHHSYTPAKDCNIVNNPVPRVERCRANTWHWDNVVIEPAVPFTIVQADRRTADPRQPTVRLDRPAPAGSMLRFTGIGNDIRFSVDGGPFTAATAQSTFAPTVVEHFTSYWVPIPEGATTIEFSGDGWFGGDWLVRSVTAWSREVGTT